MTRDGTNVPYLSLVPDGGKPHDQDVQTSPPRLYIQGQTPPGVFIGTDESLGFKIRPIGITRVPEPGSVSLDDVDAINKGLTENKRLIVYGTEPYSWVLEFDPLHPERVTREQLEQIAMRVMGKDIRPERGRPLLPPMPPIESLRRDS